ncbi:PorV/PorQ family protein [Fulvivirga lutea]|uniref:PorV/PorQ family protein n=1 Tax=Fulvivirga lutea TaxID=2810512 RepID=A0A974WIU2_9BACT|nr:hypothetical protein [Fulvivirga lutea]QSE96950.1 hypothetical protein JR347_15315 [Fulvivirga lutea]
MKLLPIIFFLACLPLLTYGQNGINELGARPVAMGNAYSTINDQWGLFYNPGGLGRNKKTVAFSAFTNRYGISGLNSLGAGFITNLPIGTLGISAFKFGDDLYSEQIASLAYANSFGIASLGFRANYLQYNIEGLGTQGIVTLDFGGTATLTEQIRFGAYIRNINQAQISTINDERAPTILYAGLGYQANERLNLTTEVEKDIDFDARFKAGLEYKFLEKFFARTGVSTNEFTNYFGLGFISQKLAIDYALTWDNTLGFSHQAALSYTIKE